MTMLAAITADAGLGIWAAYGGLPGDQLYLSSTARTGDRSFRDDRNSPGCSVTFTATSEIYVRVALRYDGYYYTNDPYVVRLQESGAGNQLELLFDRSTDQMVLLRDGTDLEVSSKVLAPNTWYVIELHAVIANSGGIAEVRINGSTDIDFSGDTQGQTSSDVDKVVIGGPDQAWNDAFFDDIVVNNADGIMNNTWPGLGGLYYLKPNAAGDQTDLTPDSGSNHERVDEIEPDDDDSYVESDAVDEYDLYELENLPADGTINAAIWHARAKLSESDEGEIARMLKIGTTEYQGSDEAITESYADKVEILELNPDDSAAWEKTDIDALQAGVKVR